MLTLEQIEHALTTGERVSQTLDNRDISRLLQFFPVSKWEAFGYKMDVGQMEPEVIPYNREIVLEKLKSDVEFAFKKALDKRGISASFMNDVLKTWMWVLEDNLQSHMAYAQYGLPLIKAIALKYGFPNEIGDDKGNEDKYASD